MKKDIRFVSKRYKWGWTVWIKVGNTKKMLASKLKSEDDVLEFIKSIRTN